MAVALVHDCDCERRPDPLAKNGDFRDCYMESGMQSEDTEHDIGLLNVGVVIPSGKGSEYERRGLLRYDLRSFIPAGATITAAAWHIYVGTTSLLGTHPLRACRIRRHDWKEDEATWKDYKTSTPWGTDGASHETTDRDILNPGYVSIPAPTTPGWKVITGASPYILGLVNDAWDNRSGICTFIVERYINMGVEGWISFHAKANPPYDPYVGTHHLRVTYTLADRTFQVMVR